MFFQKSLILNLIGNIHNISKSAIEIHNIALNNRFGSKIIENNDLISELKRDVTRNLFINKCRSLTFNEIKNLEHSIYNFRTKNIFYYTLFIIDNESTDIYNKYLYNTYNINNSLYTKEKQIQKIIYSDYNKFINKY
jgi:hypothetical protein